MTAISYAVLCGYPLSLIGVGLFFSSRMKDSSEMFAAGARSPWWLSGLSSYMTMFSAGTFVVWGGVAFRLGLVAVTILVSMGFAAMAAGYFVAGRWRRLGITTAAEYLHMRFGPGAVHFYTWLNLGLRLLGLGMATYSLAVIVCALTPLGEGAWFRDPATGNLSTTTAIVLGGAVVVTYTLSGGLWAVLVTDVLQFIVLSLAVLTAVPFCLGRVGGIGRFIADAPPGFLAPSAGEFTWMFLVVYAAIQFLRIGAEWAFVQRHVCVPSDKDARKAAYLFGVLYLVSPLMWMIPPLTCRVMMPEANPEQAYILTCQRVLPAGLVGLIVAAMFSATASTVSAEINVFAGALTLDFYRRLVRPRATEAHLVWVGRVSTLLLGIAVTVLALAIPHLGGAEKVVLLISGLLAAPTLLPPIWGLFSKRIGQSGIWVSVTSGFLAGGLLKFGLDKGGWFSEIHGLGGPAAWVRGHMTTAEVVVGLVVPLAALCILELTSRRVSAGWSSVEQRLAAYTGASAPAAASLPLRLIGWCVAIFGIGMVVVAMLEQQGAYIVAWAAVALLVVGAGLLVLGRARTRRVGAGG